jgi:hypothetical protein
MPDATNGFTLRFVDIRNDDAEALNSNQPQKSAWKKRIQVAAGLPLRITVCWTDHAAHGLQNHLDVLVQPPTGPRLIGNHDLVREPWAKTDRFNNVERVIVDKPAAGTWTILVNASNTPFPSQGFSLVVTGKSLSDFL